MSEAVSDEWSQLLVIFTSVSVAEYSYSHSSSSNSCGCRDMYTVRFGATRRFDTQREIVG